MMMVTVMILSITKLSSKPVIWIHYFNPHNPPRSHLEEGSVPVPVLQMKGGAVDITHSRTHGS